MALIRRRAAVALCATLLLPQAGALAQKNCITHAEFQAMQVRTLTSELMVAALSCRSQPQLALDDKYNQYAGHFKQALAEQGQIMQRHFARTTRGDSRKAIDKFVTESANEAAQRSVAKPHHCTAAAPIFDQVLRMNAKEMLAYALTLTDAVPGVPRKDKC